MPSKFNFPGIKGKSSTTSPSSSFKQLRKKTLLQYQKDMMDAILFGLGSRPSVVKPRGAGKSNYYPQNFPNYSQIFSTPINLQSQQSPFMAAMSATSGDIGDPDFAFFDWKKDPDYYEDDEIVLIDLTKYIRNEP